MSTNQMDIRRAWGSLRLFLSVVMIALLVGLSGTLVTIAYFRARNIALERVDEKMHAFGDRLAARLSALSGETAALVGVVAALPNSIFAVPADRLNEKFMVFRQVTRASENVESVYVGYPDGSFFQVVNLRSPSWRKALTAPLKAESAVRLIVPTTTGSSSVHVLFFDVAGDLIAETGPFLSNFDPRTRLWFQVAKGNHDAHATGPYEMATTGLLGMTTSHSLQHDLSTVVGADVVLTTVTDLLTKEKLTPGSTAFLLDSRGALVVHSNDLINDRILAGKQERDKEHPNRSDPLVAAADRVTSGRVGVVDVEGSQFALMVTPVKSRLFFAGGRLVIATPLDELLVTARRGFIVGTAIAGVAILAAGLCAVVLAHLITKSLHALTEGATRFQTLDFDTPIQVASRILEIRTLGSAMNKARDAISTFMIYVPREFVRKGMSGHFSGRAARRQEVTALFTDIYDFTTISERHSPEEVVGMLSEYFDIFNASVDANGGTIIQFLGDSVFALWNAPTADDRHAENACRAAIDIVDRLAAFNTAQRSRGLPEFATRFGIHTGLAVVGSVGATARLQYTAMGDTINVASRLEGINKRFATTILASRAVFERCERKDAFRPLGQTDVKGRTGAVEIFEVVSKP